MKEFFLSKKNIVTCLFIIPCLAGYVFFPAKDFFQYKMVALFFLVVLPFIYNKYFLKRDYFVKIVPNAGNWKKETIMTSICLIIALLIIGILFKFTDLQKHYLLSSVVKNDFWKFLWYEFAGVAFTVALYEIFFRGFIQKYFVDIFDKWSILIQLIFFIAMISMLNLPYWFYLNYLIFSPFAGWIFYKTKSNLYSFGAQLFFIIIVDATYIALVAR